MQNCTNALMQNCTVAKMQNYMIAQMQNCANAQLHKCRNAQLAQVETSPRRCTTKRGHLIIGRLITNPQKWISTSDSMHFPPPKQKHSNKLKLLFESNLNQFSLNRNKLRAQYILGWIHGPPGGVHFERKIHPVEECWKICLILNTMWNFRHWIWRPLSFSRTTLDLLKQNTCKYLLWPAKTPTSRFYFKLSADPGRRLDRCRLWCRGPKT